MRRQPGPRPPVHGAGLEEENGADRGGGVWACRVAATSSQEESLQTVLAALATIIAADPTSYGDSDSRLRTAGSLAAATISLYWATSLRTELPMLPAAGVAAVGIGQAAGARLHLLLLAPWELLPHLRSQGLAAPAKPRPGI